MYFTIAVPRKYPFKNGCVALDVWKYQFELSAFKVLTQAGK